MLNKFCNKESKELRISCAVLSVLFVVLAVVQKPAVLVGSTVFVILPAEAGVPEVAPGSKVALPVVGEVVKIGGQRDSENLYH